jgi:hypothetical protein
VAGRRVERRLVSGISGARRVRSHIGRTRISRTNINLGICRTSRRRRVNAGLILGPTLVLRARGLRVGRRVVGGGRRRHVRCAGVLTASPRQRQTTSRERSGHRRTTPHCRLVSPDHDPHSPPFRLTHVSTKLSNNKPQFWLSVSEIDSSWSSSCAVLSRVCRS